LLAIQAIVACIPYLGLIFFSPFAGVRDVVHETLDDFAPRLARRIYPAPSQGTETKVS
jgi:hypothetical protein